VPAPGETVVYTDGACIGNPGPGGWAWAVVDGPFGSGAEAHSTNQRMEITAVLKALEALDGPVLVMSDSTYVVNCFRDRWYEGWRRRGWKNTAGKPVANQDLWEPLLDLGLDPGRPVRFGWVKGHSGDTMNDRVDLLATTAAATQEAAAGDHFSG
jgi:ribonuclease HI